MTDSKNKIQLLEIILYREHNKIYKDPICTITGLNIIRQKRHIFNEGEYIDMVIDFETSTILERMDIVKYANQNYRVLSVVWI